MVTLMGVANESVAQNSGLGFNYSACVRNSDGILLTNADVTLRISLFPGQQAPAPTWIETHSVHTDASGCFGITVGKGLRDSQSAASRYSDINFAAVYYWIRIEVKEGSSFREVSFSQLPSAPYSEVAHNALPFSAGMVVPFAGTIDNIPAGWLLCDGSEVNRNEYANLYRTIGVSWGVGDGSSSFNLPDMRGMFLRGVSGDSGYDPDADARTMLKDNGGNTGNTVGTYQGDAIRNITGQFNGVDAYSIINKTTKGAFYAKSGSNKGSKGVDSDNAMIYFNASRVVPVGSDNRPVNVSVYYLIKY